MQKKMEENLIFIWVTYFSLLKNLSLVLLRKVPIKIKMYFDAWHSC